MDRLFPGRPHRRRLEPHRVHRSRAIPTFSLAAPLVQTLAPAGSSIGVNSGAGGLIGVQAGCDYQFASNWVIGVGGDFAWTDIHGVANDPFFVGKNGDPFRSARAPKRSPA